MQQDPLVSVIVPVYNVDRYIDECLDSIVKQTYQELQIIIIDDGSTDESNQKVRPYLSDSRVQLIEQVNTGLSGARNTGLRAACGKYVLFVDSDDYLALTAIGNLVDLMKKNHTDLIRFNGRAFLDGLNEPIKQNNYDFSHRLQEGVKYTDDRFEVNSRTFASPVYLYMVKREVIEQNNLSFYEGILHEDELFTTQVFLNSRSMIYANAFYYNRRYRENSIMTDQSQERLKQTFESYLIIFKELEKMYLNKIYSKEQKKLIKRQILSIYSGLKNSNVNKIEKENKIKDLKGITITDKAYLSIKKIIGKLSV
ncbi:Glycosyltransferase involved in cell wall bisynthesis [Carnobacterium alterfunditum]|uniref:Glycosyltransferase involved in cell wall bisynthesis n=1 Tax=Carnobacterium alterfunditum TaxID=28230 RepID=A0A1N6HK60_9LACT|nr:glycosyltransferase [Carnobacterium alterfunditum]SIO20113.1 Glycosyltransferase involved in cell wall bisynthesis [Carnobacterium alterfunditum]